MPSKFDPSTGGIIFIPQEKDNEVIIKSVEDFPAVIDSTVVYFFDSWIDLSTFNSVVPSTGMYVSGHGYGISGGYSTADNHTIFKTGVGTYAGDFIATGVSFYTTGTNSKIFDLDNQGNNAAFELNSVNLGTFAATTTSFGSVLGYRQIRTGDFAGIKYSEGFTLDDDIGGIAFNDSIILGNIASTIFLKAGASLNITSGMSSDMNALSLASNSIWCNFQESNFATGVIMKLTGFRTNQPTAIPNITGNSIKALFKGCVGILNTFIGASWNLTTQAETVVAATNTFYKLAGTTTGVAEAHFEIVGNNRLMYIGENDISVTIMSSIVLETSGTESLEAAIRQYDDSESSFTPINIDEKTLETQIKLVGNRRDRATLIGVSNMSKNDYIELWSKTVGGASANQTLLLKSKLLISERV